MSAYVVDHEHIAALLDAALAYGAPHRHNGPVSYFWPPITSEPGAYQEGEPRGPWSGVLVQERRVQVTAANAREVGEMLLAENVRSVNHRYAEQEQPETFTYKRRLDPLHPGRIILALDCYEYQACEGPSWATSEAHEFCQALRRRAVEALMARCCPEVDGWEITNRKACS